MNLRHLCFALALLALTITINRAASVGSAFTYQGRLADNGVAANGEYDLRFILFDVAVFGFPIGPVITNENVAVSNGLFQVTLDFGSVFSGTNYWLEIGVRPGASTGNFTILDPRQIVRPTPYALYALSAASAPLTNNAVTSAQIADGTIVNADLANNSVSSAKILNGTVVPLDLNVSAFSNTFWKVDGNSGTIPGTHFLGTTDNQPLELRVNSNRVLRFEFATNSLTPSNVIDGVNIIGGIPQNHASPGVVGATIGGGGTTSFLGTDLALSNTVAGSWGVIGGGLGNTILSNAFYGTIAGGGLNSIGTNAVGGFIGGGANNTNSGPDSVIAGGFYNVILDAWDSVIAGGAENFIANTGSHTSIGGGSRNFIGSNAQSSVIGGGELNTNNTSTYASTISGGSLNLIQEGASYATIPGGYQNTILSNAYAVAISGGENNRAGGNYTTIGGGYRNVTTGSVNYATIPGGSQNVVSGNYSFAAGQRAKALHSGSFVWADSQSADFSSSANNQFCIRAAGGVGIGLTNPASALDVNGRVRMTSFQLGTNATTGQTLTADAFGIGTWQTPAYVLRAGDTMSGNLIVNARVQMNQFQLGTVATNGQLLTANASGMGTWQTPAFVNRAGDTMTGDLTITNSADLNFGAQLRQTINLWRTNFGFGVQTSTIYARSDNLFAWYRGGTHVDAATNAGGGSIAMILGASGLIVNGTFVGGSDRNRKENIQPVNASEVLEKVAALPIARWNYKEDAATPHIGPMAQDFYAAFNVGIDDKHIATVDADGVALAAIQGLNQKLEAAVQSREAEIQSLQQRIAHLETIIKKLVLNN